MLLSFFFNDTSTTEIYTLSLHDALPIFQARITCSRGPSRWARRSSMLPPRSVNSYSPPERLTQMRSEEHTSELQSRFDLVCRLLLEKKKKKITTTTKASKTI